MPRIELDGEGTPIPKIALPPFGSESDLPPTTLTFTESIDFSVADYRALGFTHFEVWCVGASGGRGGDSTYAPVDGTPAGENLQFIYIVEEVMRPVPLSVWNLALEASSYDDYAQQVNDYFNGFGTPPQLNKVYHPGDWRHPLVVQSFGLPESFVGTWAQAENASNPSRLMRFGTVRQVLLQPSDSGMGGGGGGGGMHKVSGLLADLLPVEPIVVGEAGADAGYGQVRTPGVYVPTIAGAGFSYFAGSPVGPYAARQAELVTYFTNYLHSYPLPNASFLDPQPGEDGGASSFGDVCQASGGEGGAPGRIWNGSKFILKGDGGDGGVGGRLLAGGGGAGSVVEGVNGSDGVWIPDTGIGGGGGGGKGGRAPTGGGGFPFGGQSVNHLATAGGQGSYSFADTSVFGSRQFRQAWAYIQPLRVFDSVTGLQTGAFTLDPRTSAELIIPGGGGGARPFPNMKYGGRGTGFSPNGVVVLRLTKIT